MHNLSQVFQDKIIFQNEKLKIAVWALDDSKPWLLIMQYELKKFGINLVVFHEHETFFEAINKDVDVVLLDVNMPDRKESDGKFKTEQGLRKIYDVKKDMLVILMTAEMDLSTAIGYLQSKSIFKFVQKGNIGENNNPILSKGVWTKFNCFEAIRIYIEECREEIARRKIQNLIYSNYDGR